MREIRFENAGTKLFAVESGEGRPIVLLHGGLANHLACRVFGAPLDARYRLITPDLRGSGRSIFRDELSWDLLASDIVALLRALGLERAVIGGVSMGAAVATRAALRHPDVIDKLVILSPAYGGTELGLNAAQRRAMRAMDDAGCRAPEEGVEVLLPLFDALPESVRDRATRLISTYDAQSVATTTSFMASLVQPFECGEDLQQIAAPTLVVPGVDATHPREAAEVFRVNVKSCSFVEAEPPRYAEAIAAFVD
jgi:pimeloyl-ACP methyl ester carboxylesterase